MFQVRKATSLLSGRHLDVYGFDAVSKGGREAAQREIEREIEAGCVTLC